MMSQDNRYSTIIGRMIAARKSLHLAAELAQSARIPTKTEWQEVEDLIRQINRECVRIHKAINV